jgi:hypothetical protein
MYRIMVLSNSSRPFIAFAVVLGRYLRRFCRSDVPHYPFRRYGKKHFRYGMT